MNFFKTGLQSVLGTNEVNETASGAETVSEIKFVLICKFLRKFLLGRTACR